MTVARIGEMREMHSNGQIKGNSLSAHASNISLSIEHHKLSLLGAIVQGVKNKTKIYMEILQPCLGCDTPRDRDSLSPMHH